MTAPHPVLPGKFLLVTRRCTQRTFLLRPDAETNNAFTYVLGEAAQRFGMDIILSQMMSNHHHTVVYDRLGNQVEFREHFHKMLAKSQNALRGRWENMWSTEESSVVELVSLDTLIDKLVYTATNHVLDGLVERVHHWPGPKLTDAFLRGKVMRARRPAHFFSPDGSMPDEIELRLGLPDHVPDKAEVMADVEKRIAEVEARCAEERAREGRRVVGRRCVLRQPWRNCPTTHEPRRDLRPRIACRNKWLRLAALQRNRAWEEAYHQARRAWLVSGAT